MIFLLQLKNSMDENFLHRLFPDFFQKLFFADPLKYSLTFADFPDLVETLFTFLSKHLLFFPYQLPNSSPDSHIAFLRKESTAPNSLQCSRNFSRLSEEHFLMHFNPLVHNVEKWANIL